MSAERGQATVEWVGLVLVVSLAVAAFAAVAGLALPGAALAQAVGARIACAIELGGDCETGGPLAAAYGGELAAMLSERAPAIRYEEGMSTLPVDYRDCREDACAEGGDRIRVSRSQAGLPVSAFTHVVDCREDHPVAPPGAVCEGAAAGNLYLQYWLYYPGSATGEGSTPLQGAIREISDAVGRPSFHPDDWESLQLRIEPGGAVYARASAHHGYGFGWLPLLPSGYTVSGGSHAGTVRPADFARVTPADRLSLIPLEPIVAADPETEFAVTPPWRKRVWLDPEYDGTD